MPKEPKKMVSECLTFSYEQEELDAFFFETSLKHFVMESA